MGILNNWLKRILHRGPVYNGPFLKPSYNVSDEDGLLATLTRPFIPDQFWIEFVLTPTTDDPSKLAKLYSSEFWLSDDIIITESDSQLQVNFLLSPYAVGQSDEEVSGVDPLEHRPERVILRGPYEK